MAISQPMQLALQLAQNGCYLTHPNPQVGAVIVDATGRVVAQGWHAKCGEAHAEAAALASLPDVTGPLICYVTLEPCCTFGKTPPCTDALIASGISKVVYATADPNPAVAGLGIAKLEQAGIEVCCEPEAGVWSRWINRGYHSVHASSRPWVQAKTAMSLDARVALSTGESKWITGVEARQQVQYERARSQMIVTGGGTFRADKPRLNVRYHDWPQSSHDAIGAHYSEMATDLTDPRSWSDWPQPQKVCVSADANISLGKDWLQTPSPDWADMTGQLQNTSGDSRTLVQRLMVEAGPTLTGHLIEQQAVDELLIFIAPILLGNTALPAWKLPEPLSLNGQQQWQLVESATFANGDSMLRYGRTQALERIGIAPASLQVKTEENKTV